MKLVRRYLKDPKKVGVNVQSFKIDTEEIWNFAKATVKSTERKQGHWQRTLQGQGLIQPTLKELKDMLRAEGILHRPLFWANLLGTANCLHLICVAREELHPCASFVDFAEPVIGDFKLHGPIPLSYIPDAAQVTPTYSKDMLMLNFASIKQVGALEFRAYIESLPLSVTSTGIIRSCAVRNCFRPYAAVSLLWINEEAHGGWINKKLRQAIGYYFDEEWVTSIIWSTIIIEMLLARTFERLHGKPASKLPMGPLLRRVSSALPPGTISTLEVAREARNRAVHLSHARISSVDARSCVVAAIQLLLLMESQSPS